MSTKSGLLAPVVRYVVPSARLTFDGLDNNAGSDDSLSFGIVPTATNGLVAQAGGKYHADGSIAGGCSNFAATADFANVRSLEYAAEVSPTGLPSTGILSVASVPALGWTLRWPLPSSGTRMRVGERVISDLFGDALFATLTYVAGPTSLAAPSFGVECGSIIVRSTIGLHLDVGTENANLPIRVRLDFYQARYLL